MAGGGGAQQGNPMYNVIFIGIIVVIFWVFLIQPQRRQQKEQEKLISSLKKGDRVVTQSGIHGVVTQTRDKTMILRVDDHTKIEFDKQVALRLKKGK
ncbi:MAG: preprotein translocase subunit YajC [Candidatus Cloacimonetes bacterium 4572_55]|nr:MAG: preprotein translocase subunit YajC [Candidatus Cloacimonetes bacterium 4572_55]